MRKSLKLALIAVASMCAAGSMAACSSDPTPTPGPTPVTEISVKSVTVSQTEANIKVGQTYTIATTVLPEDATNKALTFASLRPTIATVDENGVIKGIAEGTSVVTVKSVDNPAANAQIIVTVTKSVVPVESVTLDVDTLEVLVGEQKELTATVLPENATDKTVSFSSLEEDVATVTSDGKVNGVAAGTTYVICSANDGSGKQDKVKVVVSESHVPVTSISIGSEKSITLEPGASQKIDVTVLPANATDKSLTFTSTDTNVALVDEEGNLTAKTEGSCSIVIQSVDNPSLIESLNVIVSTSVTHVTGVDISEESKTVEENAEPFQLTATVSPVDASNKSVTWTSSAPSIASVSANGLVTPIKAGEALITVTTADGGFYKSCLVSITKTEIESLTMSESSILFEVTSNPETDDKTHQLVATIAPSTATYKDVAWSSSNPSVASVDQNGLVTKGTVMGTATISAVHKNSGLVATCVVTVRAQAVTKIELNHTTLSFQLGFEDETGERQLSATVTPATAPNTAVKYESSNDNVVTVDALGKVTLVGYGTDGKATITCTSEQNPTVSASCEVTVAKANEYKLALPVQTSKAYASYLSNRGSKLNPLEEFEVKNKSYKVGDDNPINLTPRLAVYKDKTPVDQSNWAYPYDITIEKKVDASYVPATIGEAEVISARSCDLQFKADAIGNEYRVTIIPGGLTAAQKALDSAKAVYSLEVIDGFNVTNEFELSYLDDTRDGDPFDKQLETGDNKDISPNYETFKTAHNLDKDLHPTSLILQNDMVLTTENLPENFFYNAEAAATWSDNEKSKSLGSLRDRVFLYAKLHSTSDISLEGNYFSIDWSKIPVVRRPNGEAETPTNKVNSHSSFMRSYYGTTSVSDVNIIGNAHAAQTELQNYAQGGLIGFKFTGDCDSFIADNIVEHACYITFMSEAGYEQSSVASNGYYSNMKCFDNYNSFLYNWGGIMQIENSYFEGCGGPVMIQDHAGIDVSQGEPHDTLDTDHGTFTVHGFKPETTFIDCEFNNYVIGTEAWFVSFGASALSQTIKGFSDFITAADSTNHLTYLFDENKAGTTYTASATAGKDCMMNMIVLNKSSSAEGVTAVPADGEVKFIESGVTKDDFNYMNPTSMTALTPEEQQRFGKEAITYSAFRGVNNAGAPVIETAGGHCSFYASDPSHPETGSLTYMEMMAAANSAELAAAMGISQAQAAAAMGTLPTGCFNSNGHLTLYYNGMALVFETTTVGA